MNQIQTASTPRYWKYQAVAIMRRLPPGREIVALTKVNHIGPRLIETTDHRWFSVSTSESLDGDGCYIEPATFEHLAAVRWNQSI
jgi:hypothetical protein